MPRYTNLQYRRSVFVLMAIYVALMLLEWPHARETANLPLKIFLTLLPVIPVVSVIWLLGQRVARSDELQQRVHLIALSGATGVVATLSLIGGFLSATGVLAFDGDVLIWIFPALCMTYGITRWWLARGYGGGSC